MYAFSFRIFDMIYINTLKSTIMSSSGFIFSTIYHCCSFFVFTLICNKSCLGPCIADNLLYLRSLRMFEDMRGKGTIKRSTTVLWTVGCRAILIFRVDLQHLYSPATTKSPLLELQIFQEAIINILLID